MAFFFSFFEHLYSPRISEVPIHGVKKATMTPRHHLYAGSRLNGSGFSNMVDEIGKKKDKRNSNKKNAFLLSTSTGLNIFKDFFFNN